MELIFYDLIIKLISCARIFSHKCRVSPYMSEMSSFSFSALVGSDGYGLACVFQAKLFVIV